MIRRQKSMRFLGGFYAFPGGKVDPEDGEPQILARCRGITAAQAERLVRELLEETGVLPACDSVGRSVALADATAASRIEVLRAAHMAKRAPLAALLAAEGWYLDLEPFRYLSHFITPPSSPIRFTARFFLAPVPVGQSPRLFHEEASESFWVDPAEGFRRHRSGEWAMAEPADCGLGYIAQFDTLAEVWRAHEDGRHKFHGILDRVQAAGVEIRRGADGRTPAAP
ncbi:MAG: Nudix hydrolase protein [Candidatus Rokubacteria bacterium]|nr:Nudix hydrolase protein [Candidatus Rokubacteria bacterium]